MTKIIVYTDGALRQYPDFKLGAWCYYAFDQSGIQVKARIVDEKEDSGATNNRMEVKAVIEACKIAPKNAIFELHADSKYVLLGLNRNCISKTNKDLWTELGDLIRTKHLIVKSYHVYGHQGHTGNEVADQTMRAMLDQVIKKRKHAMQKPIF